MKLIINTTTLSGTGVTQVAVSFLNECIAFPQNEYHVFLSKQVHAEIDMAKFPKNFSFYKFEGHPLYGLKGYRIRKKLRSLEHGIKPDLVFSIFGPSCWTPKTKHVSGFANSYYVYPDSPFFKVISFRDRFRIKVMQIAHRFFLKRNGQYFICETDDMSQRLCNFLKVNKSNVFTVSNTYNKYFETFNDVQNACFLPPRSPDEYRFVTPASFDVHKNLVIINKVIPHITKALVKRNVKFVLTVNPILFEKHFSAEAKQYIINVGRISVTDCPQLYSECDALFLPTLIESFSANYPEAMRMSKPILTSHYSFAKSICADAALYFDPLDAKDVALKIENLLNNAELSQSLVSKGKKRLKVFGNPAERAKTYLDIFRFLIK